MHGLTRTQRLLAPACELSIKLLFYCVSQAVLRSVDAMCFSGGRYCCLWLRRRDRNQFAPKIFGHGAITRPLATASPHRPTTRTAAHANSWRSYSRDAFSMSTVRFKRDERAVITRPPFAATPHIKNMAIAHAKVIWPIRFSWLSIARYYQVQCGTKQTLRHGIGHRPAQASTKNDAGNHGTTMQATTAPRDGKHRHWKHARPRSRRANAHTLSERLEKGAPNETKPPCGFYPVSYHVASRIFRQVRQKMKHEKHRIVKNL